MTDAVGQLTPASIKSTRILISSSVAERAIRVTSRTSSSRFSGNAAVSAASSTGKARGSPPASNTLGRGTLAQSVLRSQPRRDRSSGPPSEAARHPRFAFGNSSSIVAGQTPIDPSSTRPGAYVVGIETDIYDDSSTVICTDFGYLDHQVSRPLPPASRSNGGIGRLGTGPDYLATRWRRASQD